MRGGINILTFDLRKVLLDIINNTYPSDKYPDNKFSKFYLDIKPTERKTFHGDYNRRTKVIRIFNLSRDSKHIIITVIHEVAHHVDYCMRGDTDHGKSFYEVMRDLLVSALRMGIITKNNISTIVDNADKERLEKHFGSVQGWDYKVVDYKKDKSKIKVRNCFKIKDTLSLRGYTYSGMEQVWEREVDNNILNDEKEFLSKIIDMDNVTINLSNDINIEAVYYIVVSKSFNYKDVLKNNGYIYNGFNINKKTWNKKILATEKDRELSFLRKLPGVDIKIMSRK